MGIALPAGASPYAQAHEFAHAEQHATGSVAWLAFHRFRTIPVLGRMAMLTVETEAAWLALMELRRCGVLRRGDVGEALGGLRTYVRALFA